MIWGGDDRLPLRRQDAAKASGIADVTLRNSLAHPLTMKFYNEQMDVLRSGARPRGLHRIIDLVDNARTERVQFEAAKYLDGGDKAHGGVTVNVGVNIAPGYMVDATGFDAERRTQLLKLARSSRNILTDQANETISDLGTSE